MCWVRSAIFYFGVIALIDDEQSISIKLYTVNSRSLMSYSIGSHCRSAEATLPILVDLPDEVSISMFFNFLKREVF